MKQQHNRPLLGLAFIALSSVLVTNASAYELRDSKKLLASDPNVEALASISKGVSAVAATAKKAIVFVSVSKTVKGVPFGMINPFEFFFGPGPQQQQPQPQQAPERRQEGLGSGFFVDIDKGYILTNNHVVADADEINLKLANGEHYAGKVVGRDKNTDVAVVQLDEKNWNKNGIAELALGNSSEVTVGDLVIALGAPFGLEASLSFGAVSALGRGSLAITELGDFIQTDAAINPGNSGGPLLNIYGEVIGVNTAIYSKSGGYNGIGFAIPSNLARTVAEQLITSGKIQRGYLGVGLYRGFDPELARDLDLPSGAKGALVSAVEPNGPAEKAGFKAGDVIFELDGKKVDSDVQLRNRIGLLSPGSTVKLKVYRDGGEKLLTVKLGNFPDQGEPAKLEPGESRPYGLLLSKLNRGLMRQYDIDVDYGAVVTGVEQNSPADRAGLQEGDVILKVNNKKVSDPSDFYDVAKSKKRLYLSIWRDRKELFVPLRK